MNLLKDILVVDVTELAPGPLCTELLADLGASVIKVERPTGDPLRKMIPGAFECLNRNKKSIALNLKKDDEKTKLFKLIEKANVFVENYRPYVAQRLGVGYEQVKLINSDIIYCSISGYGQNGPYSKWPGHDINYCAVSGLSNISGDPEGPPDIGAGVPIADYSSSLFACISILSMLCARKGGYLDVSMTECCLYLMSSRINEYLDRGKPSKKKLVGRGGYGIYKAKDGKYFAIAPIEDHFWKNFCKVIDRDDLANDERFETFRKRNENRNVLNPILDEKFMLKNRKEWMSILTKADVPFSPVNNFDDLVDDLHLKSRGLISEKEREGRKFMNISFPVVFNGDRLPLRFLAPASPGHDTDEIFSDIGMSKTDISDFKSKMNVV